MFDLKMNCARLGNNSDAIIWSFISITQIIHDTERREIQELSKRCSKLFFNTAKSGRGNTFSIVQLKVQK